MKKQFKYLVIFSALLVFLSCQFNESNIISEKEIEWLKEHPNLTIGICPKSPPYEYINENNEVSGMFIDFLSLIESRLDYKFKKVYESDFTKLLDGAKMGSIDVLFDVQKTDNRQKYLNFTPTLISNRYVILTKNTRSEITSIDDLKNITIGVGKSYSIQEYLKRNYSNYNIIPYSNAVSCLRDVSTGQIDAFISRQAVATFFLESEGISNLKIVGGIDYSNKLSLSSRKGLEILNTILSKAVNSISATEKQNIYSKWLTFETKPFYRETKFWFTIVVLFLIVIILGFIFNITLHNRVKIKTKELKDAKEKAEESDELKTEFLHNMSHEIRTPLNAICGFSGFLDNPELSDKKRMQFVSIIQNNSNQLLSIITDVLTISSIESKQEKLNIQEVCINTVLIELVAVFKKQANDKNISLLTQLELTDKQSIIETDKIKVTQILTNLLTNSLKFTKEGIVELGYIINDRFIEFYVRDSGIGLKTETHKKIFERFHQADPSIATNYGGTGLGLSISKGFVELLGGKIWVKSELKIGSTFYFTIPYKKANLDVLNSSECLAEKELS